MPRFLAGRLMCVAGRARTFIVFIWLIAWAGAMAQQTLPTVAQLQTEIARSGERANGARSYWTERLLPSLSSPEANARGRVAELLGVLWDKRSIQPLVKVLDSDAVQGVRESAARTLVGMVFLPEVRQLLLRRP